MNISISALQLLYLCCNCVSINFTAVWVAISIIENTHHRAKSQTNSINESKQKVKGAQRRTLLNETFLCELWESSGCRSGRGKREKNAATRRRINSSGWSEQRQIIVTNQNMSEYECQSAWARNTSMRQKHKRQSTHRGDPRIQLQMHLYATHEMVFPILNSK